VLTDITGLLLLVPPTRRLVAAGIRRVLERRKQDGTFRVTHFGGLGGFGGPGPVSQSGAPSWPTQRPTRNKPGEVEAEFTEDRRGN
jgi:UPF0716 protein FxsA